MFAPAKRFIHAIIHQLHLRAGQPRQQLKMFRLIELGESFSDTLPQGYEYATCGPDEINGLVRLLDQSGEFPALGIWNSETVASVILRKITNDGTILVRNADEIVACTSICRYGKIRRQAVLMYVLTHRAHRRRGLGQAMTQRALRVCQRNSLRKVSLRTDSYRLDAVKLYLKNGFRPVITSNKRFRAGWGSVLSRLH